MTDYGYGEICRKAKEHGVKLKWAVERRIIYLYGIIRQISQYLPEATTDENEAIAIELIKNLKKEIDYLQDKITVKPRDDKQSAIVDEMIEQAKAYSVDRLIDFNRGKALAFCHDDHNPSLSHWKETNLARCFVCNKTFNAIDILIHRDGLTFQEAVRRLNNE